MLWGQFVQAPAAYIQEDKFLWHAVLAGQLRELIVHAVEYLSSLRIAIQYGALALRLSMRLMHTPRGAWSKLKCLTGRFSESEV